jgi:serine/threonine protein kinase/beta-lactam-binding protein with PASTA domain
MIDRVLNNRYRPTSLVGEGGMAMVYEAEDLLLGRKVAVKILREQFASDPGFLARFRREAKAAAALSHPNVVAIYDVGSDGPTQYIVMELVRGRTLKQIIQEEGPVSSARAISLGRQICEGLEYAHEHGIVHRDVKSQNILVGRESRVKITDFGIAVALGASSLTESGHVVGSAQYFSPEQARGEQATALSDIYAAGVVLYEMATGQLPFEAETPVAVALKQVQEAPAPPRRLNPRIPESLQAVILRAMAKDPAQRFESGRAMAGALLAYAQSSLEATISQPVPVPASTTRGARPQAPTVVKEPAQPVRRQGSGRMAPLVLVLLLFLLLVGSITVGILTSTNGSLQRLFPTLGQAPTAVPPPTAQPVAAPTVAPIPVKVPQLVGKPFPQAEQQAQADGLNLVIGGSVYNADYPVTYIVTQKPTAGDPIQKNGRIEVTVSLGREIVGVPAVVGDTAPNAEGKLQAAGLLWKILEELSDQAPAGVVMEQNPAANARVEKGSDVVLTVSKGKQKVLVPSLVGKPEAEAQDTIVNAGLTKTWVNYQIFTTVPPGAVISQDPKPGTMVEKGTTVYIAVRRSESPTPAARTPTPPPTLRKKP